MSTQNKGGHIFDGYIKFFCEKQAEPCRIQHPSHANHLGRWQTRGALQNPDHDVKRVGDANNKSIRAMFFDTSANLIHHFGIDTDQIIAAHAWLARHTSGDNDHVTVSQSGIIIRPGNRRIKSFNRA